MAKKGKLIVIEGTDGSGKATQTKRLVARAIKEGYPIESHSFPVYDSSTGKTVRAMLGGEWGDPTNLDYKRGGVTYLADRVMNIEPVEINLYRGINEILDRYVESNKGHQIAKIEDARERKRLRKDIVWFFDTVEYGLFGLPRPDTVVFLDLPIEEAKKAAITRGEKLDGHEANYEYQERVRESYRWLARVEGWNRIDCMTGRGKKKRRKTEEEIAEEVWIKIGHILVR